MSGAVDPARYQRIRALLEEAERRRGPERDAWLAEACAGDDALRAEVGRLLAAASVATGDLAPVTTMVGLGAEVAPGALVGPWRVDAILGSGGMGVVHDARHVVTGRRVALKVFHPHLVATAANLERFRREAEAGRRVEHPNVVRTLETGTASVDGRPVHYIALEFVEGRTLRDLLRSLGRVPEALLREIAEQVAEGLAAIHAAGIVHRDLKPENVLLTADQRVRITDLGVAKFLEVTSDLTVGGHFVGSLHYASPEQCEGRPVGPAADLYALGVTLYELATGENPFRGESPVSILRAHVETTPVPAALQNPRVSPFLGAVIDTLLAKEPTRRFPSARDLAAVLAEGETGPWWTERRRGAVESAGSGPPLRGREDLLVRVAAAFERAAQGEGQVLLLTGEPGVGKSRLLGEVLTRLGGPSVDVLHAVHERGGGGGLLAAVNARAAARDASSEPEEVREALAAVGSVGQSALGKLLRAVAGRRPALWIVDDVSAADPEARRTVWMLARVAVGCRALLLLTADEPPPPEELAPLQALRGFAVLPIPRLPPEAIRALIADAVGDDALAERLAPRLNDLAAGVPLFALEILRDLERRGHLARRADGGYAAVGPLEDVEVPTALRDLVRARLASLSRDDLAILGVAAVQGEVFDVDVIARVREARRLQVLETLGYVERRLGLVRGDGKSLRFDHPLVQEVLYEDLTAELRAEVHRLVAEAHAARVPSPEAAPPDVSVAVTYHHLRGNAPREALPWFRAALERLEARGRLGAALDLVEGVLAVPQLDPEQVVRLRIRQAALLHALGRLAEERRVLDEAQRLADDLGDTELRVDVRASLGLNLVHVARFADALAALDAVASEALALPAVHARAQWFAARGQVLWCLGRYEDARAAHEEGVATARAAGLEGQEAKTSCDLAIVYHESGRFEEAETLLRKALAIMRKNRDLRSAAVAVSNLGNVLHDQGRKVDAVAAYEESLGLARDLGMRDMEAVARVNIGAVSCSLGNLADAERHLKISVAICRETGSRRVEAYGHHGLGCVAQARGDLAGAREAFRAALALRREIRSDRGIGETLYSLGCLELDAGDREEGTRLMREAERLARTVEDPGAVPATLARLALLPGGSPEEARRAYEAARANLGGDTRMDIALNLHLATGDRSYLEEAHAILERLASFVPPERLRDLIEAVPVHARLEAAWRAAGGKPILPS